MPSMALTEAQIVVGFFLLRQGRNSNSLLYFSGYPLQVGRVGQTKRKNN